jgi:hypothetical protein
VKREDAIKIIRQAAEAEKQTPRIGLVGEGGWSASDALPRALAVIVAEQQDEIGRLRSQVNSLLPQGVQGVV